MKIIVRPSHIEAYQNEILNESISDINIDDIKQRNSDIFTPITESIDDIISYTKNHSDSVKIVADMFKLDKLNCVLTESGTRMSIEIDDHTTANVHIE